MAGLAQNRNTQERLGERAVYPLADNVIVYLGSMVVLDASGNAKPGVTATGLKCAGVAALAYPSGVSGGPGIPGKQADNTQVGHAAGAVAVECRRGCFKLDNSGSDAVDATCIGNLCFVVDDHTVSKTDGTGTQSPAGRVVAVDSDGVWVDFRHPEMPRGEVPSGQTLRIDNGGVLDASATAAADVKLPAGAIVTADIADANVTSGKLAAGAAIANVGAGGVATANVAAGAITPPKMSFAGLKVLAIVGHNGAGACTATGAAVGDRLVAIFGAPTAGGALAAFVPGTDFEATVSVAAQLQQLSASNLSTDTLIGVFAPAAA